MAIRKVLRLGHPLLRERAREVQPSEIGTPSFSVLLEDLKDTMEAEGGIGIAAPQIGESWRVSIIGFEAGETRYRAAISHPLTVYINPEIKILDGSLQSFWEGCLSVPGLRGKVERPRAIEVKYLDVQGQAQVLQVEGFLATVFQHEFDHLDGVLYVDRVRDTRDLAFLDEYIRFIDKSGDASIE